MESALYVATAAQRNIQKQLTVVANNIANMNTAGFRAENVDFNSIVSRVPNENVHFPTVAKLYPAVEQGTHILTDNPLDVAISGDAWFAISTEAGTVYTRDGRFQLNAFGELQTLSGYPVLDAGEAPIQINGTGVPEIAKDGRILVDGRIAGNIGIFEVPVDSLVSRHSNSGFIASTPGLPVAAGNAITINQGFVENSNINPIKELGNLIAITKSYESASSLIDRVDQALSRSIRELGGA